ncbi:MAG: carboxypeptidase-like regulatory domain-containing protein, partial [Rufibacter sp.]
MNKFYPFLVLILMIITYQGQAQSTGRITGVVRDRNTQEPVIGATVALEATTIAAATDAQGRYRLG